MITPRKFRPLALALGLCVAAPFAGAQSTKPTATQKSTQPATKPAPTYKVGDPAAKLSISKWVKGEPVPAFEKGKVYVVEFWATWCMPCKFSIPHISKLQAEFKEKGLTVIGVDIWEPDVAKVEPFVTKMGDKMAYTVGIEEPITDGKPVQGMPKGRMAVDWMQASGQEGIPSAFIVDRDGKIVWIGYPMGMRRPLSKVLDGTFDAKVEADFEKQLEDLDKKADKAVTDKQYDEALKLRDELTTMDPDEADSQKLEKMIILGIKGDAAAANTIAIELADRAAKEKDLLLSTRVASLLLNGPTAAKSDPATVLKAAQTAYELGEESLASRKLLAQAYAANKQYDKAIELQTKVVGALNGPLKIREQKLLEEYKKAAGQA